MQTFGSWLVTLLAASAELASALPQRLDTVQPTRRTSGQTMSVPVTHNLNRRSKYAHPALARAKALRKFGGDMPANVQAVVDRFALSLKRGDEQGSVSTSATSEDTEWITSISVGTPAQTLPMDFDTGSSDLWVMGASTSGTSGHTTYNANTSTSAEVMSGASWTISYGDGSSSSGDVYTDAVTIGNLTVTKQAVEVATTLSSEFTSDTALSGLVGLAMSSINTVKPTAQQTWFDNIKSSLASPLFTADLKHGEQGSYNFGYIDSSAYTGDIYYADLVTGSTYGGFWSFVATGYSVGTNASSASSSSASTSSATSVSTLSATSFSTSSATSFSTSTTLATTANNDAPLSSSSASTPLPTATITLSEITATGSPVTPTSDASGGHGGGHGGGHNGGFGGGYEDEGDSSSSSGWGEFGESDGDDGLAEAFGELAAYAGLDNIDGVDGPDWFVKEKRGTKTTPAKRTTTASTTAITGIADTGTTLLMLPDAVVAAYYAEVNNATDSTQEGGYIFPCDATLPDFTFNVGEGSITVPGEYLNFEPISTGSSQCYGGLQSDSGIGIAIFGDVALKSALVVFDSGNSRLGWAAKKSLLFS